MVLFVSLLVSALAPRAAAQEAAATERARYAIDLTSQPSAIGALPVRNMAGERCLEADGADRGLALAVVVYGRKLGASMWGHTSLRFLYCEAGALRDVEFEYYRFSRGTLANLSLRYPDATFPAAGTDRRRNVGHLYIWSTEDPSDVGAYAKELERNREIYEVWLDLTAAQVTSLLNRLRAREARQLARLEAGERLAEGRYVALGRNCTVPIREVVAVVEGAPLPPQAEGADEVLAPGVFPFVLLKRLEGRTDVTLVSHPSSHALRLAMDDAGGRDQWAALYTRGQAVTPRLSPLVRSRVRPEDRFWLSRTAADAGPPLAEAQVVAEP